MERKGTMETKRAVSSGAEEMIGVVHKVLDRGELELISYMGTDAELCRIAAGSGAARVLDPPRALVADRVRPGRLLNLLAKFL